MKSENKYGIPQIMECNTITFTSDGFRLSGKLHLPGTDDPPVVIGSHGLLSSADSPKQIALANECAGAGMAYLRFDHRGCGGSQGNFEKDTSLKTRCRDMRHAVDYLKSRGFSCNRTGLFGSSMGGAVCISMAMALSADALVINAAPVKLDRIRSILETAEPLPANLKFDITHKLKQLHRILLFHGDADEVVSATHADLIYKHAGQPKRLVTFPNGDHYMSNHGHQRIFTRESVQWFRQHLINTPIRFA